MSRGEQPPSNRGYGTYWNHYRPPLSSSYYQHSFPIQHRSFHHTFLPTSRHWSIAGPFGHCNSSVATPRIQYVRSVRSHSHLSHSNVSDPHTYYSHSKHRQTPSSYRVPQRPRVSVENYRSDHRGIKYPTLSIVTYNLLAQDLIGKNMSLYYPGEHLEWEYRRQRLLNELLATHADIYCLQELQEEHYYNWYYPNLKANGYEGIFQKRTGLYTDGCAIFYLTHKLLLPVHNKVLFQKNTGTLIRDNVGIIAKFNLSSFHYSSFPLKSFCLATTHLLFNHKAGEIKLAQICYLMAELHKVASSDGSLLPCVLCGDFNSLPNSPMLEFLLNGKLDTSDLSAWNVSGYKRSSLKERLIPIPLLPENIGISQNCTYRTQSFDETGIRNSVIVEEGCGQQLKAAVLPSSDGVVVNNGGNMIVMGEKTEMRNFCSDGPVSSISNSQLLESSRCRPCPILTHPFTLRSGYPLPKDGEQSPTVTTYHRSACETVDYIFYTPPPAQEGAAACQGFHLVSRTALPSQHTLRHFGPQPNHAFSSDHLFLQVDLQLLC